MILYEKVYVNLKNKIICGILPAGSQLPSRAKLCEEFNTSEKTVRRSLELLAQEGLIATQKRKRPIIIYQSMQKTSQLALKQADAIAAVDALRTGVLLCYPLIDQGLKLCQDADWAYLRTIIVSMETVSKERFWQLSNQFWRYLIARNGNELMLRVVDSLGFSELESLHSDAAIRETYRRQLTLFLKTVKNGGDPASVKFDDMSAVYGLDNDAEVPPYQVKPDSIFCVGCADLEQKVRKSEERYSSICVDILGRIAIGQYPKGSRLPSHKELQSIYGVSIDTTLKAIKELQVLGALKAAPHSGIEVMMDLDELKQAPIKPELIAGNIRLLLDSLELLALSVEGVAASVVSAVLPDDCLKLQRELETAWHDPFDHRFIAGILLQFIIDHIQYETLKTIYVMIRKNFIVGRRLPGFISKEKSQPEYEIYKLCMKASAALEKGERDQFAVQTAHLFQLIHLQIIRECSQLNYLEAAMNYYDAAKLWQ
ncbi:GntR family transcriptional regulator [Dielma fastidiosa]|uniref:Regulatory GntR family protein n=1 Tax=Dielma fastidiosa TaxID=1034346 RepID=A0A318KK89_9FIRM|nr:GntR family transcriptional regulator [Dielma fastidiosa]PXX75221.1 regulatory GntR family protein [Dielma fastidiosa]